LIEPNIVLLLYFGYKFTFNHYFAFLCVSVASRSSESVTFPSISPLLFSQPLGRFEASQSMLSTLNTFHPVFFFASAPACPPSVAAP
jgi:hypothetical protein